MRGRLLRHHPSPFISRNDRYMDFESVPSPSKRLPFNAANAQHGLGLHPMFVEDWESLRNTMWRMERGWVESYDGKSGQYIGKQARKHQTWSIASYLMAKMMSNDPSHLCIISLKHMTERNHVIVVI
ncbi:hypothetical protein L1987_58281 [Smallanthus sonchifolius]|uniref:Uncharacterized protein n=1 Tax=Smallanthus sonchifolius TaxID=185202 RepID=A0ACB9DFC4_9ASTR|nr:hypothetical protein L1987_58281 [Smallanthus sonchifolius]